MLSVTYKHVMRSVVILNVVTLSVVFLNVVTLSVIAPLKTHMVKINIINCRLDQQNVATSIVFKKTSTGKTPVS